MNVNRSGDVSEETSRRSDDREYNGELSHREEDSSTLSRQPSS